jgi:hypothetical protein
MALVLVSRHKAKHAMHVRTSDINAVSQSLHIGTERIQREQLGVGVLDRIEAAQHDGLALLLGAVKDCDGEDDRQVSAT